MPLPSTMSGVALAGYGGLDCLQWRDDLPMPDVGANDVLIRVAAAGVNYTDINTRTGWYAKSITGATSDDAQLGADEDGTRNGKALAHPAASGPPRSNWPNGAQHNCLGGHTT